MNVFTFKFRKLNKKNKTKDCTHAYYFHKTYTCNTPPTKKKKQNIFTTDLCAMHVDYMHADYILSCNKK